MLKDNFVVVVFVIDYRGIGCQLMVNHCADANICENGGTCVNLAPGFRCDCPPGRQHCTNVDQVYEEGFKCSLKISDFFLIFILSKHSIGGLFSINKASCNISFKFFKLQKLWCCYTSNIVASMNILIVQQYCSCCHISV